MPIPRHELDPLEVRLRTLLPEEYQDSYEEVQPVPMKSAGLRFDGDGSVAWDEMWASFCDLAMAGGPPHKGSLLEPGRGDVIEAQPARYAAVVEEIRRGIRMVTMMEARPSPHAGWVRITCDSQAMAGWLLRAIVMENVSARVEGRALDLPAAPTFRLEKEIKNVVTVTAKTDHYWSGHLSPVKQRIIGKLLDAMASEAPLVVPPGPGETAGTERQQTVARRITEAIHHATGLARFDRRYADWIGIDCGTVRAAIWTMRLIVAGNALARREGTIVFVPVNAVQDPDGARVVDIVARVRRLAATRGVM
jgi:hypothetical protein